MNLKQLAAFLFATATLVLGVGPSWGQEKPASLAQTTHKVGLAYPDSRLTEFHKQVLNSMNLPFTVVESEHGTTVYWMPRTEAEEMEVQRRVSQYGIHLQTCGADGAPTPEAPSQPVGVPIHDPCGKRAR
jgi:hypothetical protein